MDSNNEKSQQSETFIWHKKLDKEGLNELDTETRKYILEKKKQETLIELEKVKIRRKERELELLSKQNERDDEIRKKENENYEQYILKEKEFEFLQAKERSKIRIKNGRHQPIDLMASFIHKDILEEDGIIQEDLVSKVKMIEPVKLVNELELNDLENFKYDIKFYIKFDIEHNLDFWNDLLLVVDEKISDKINDDKIVSNRSRGRHAVENLNQKTTVQDIDKIFTGKTIEQLKILQEQLTEKSKKLQKSNVDASYWDSVLHRLKVRVASLTTTLRYKDLVKERLIKIHTKDIENDDNKINNELLNLDSFITKEVKISNTPIGRELYLNDCYSPILIAHKKLNPQFNIIDATAYYSELKQQQDYIINGSKVADDKMSIQMYCVESTRKMDEDEEEFTQEMLDQNQDNCRIATHYKLIKPKYFNKINTGFEWNKYNQTHYDVDNPPPKVIQGYKFNIFYPNLLDQTKTPSYTVIKCNDNNDYNIIKFSGGPPYEDIAFKIVNGEWDVGDRSNFLCQYENGVFQLWFQFRKYRYRR